MSTKTNNRTRQPTQNGMTLIEILVTLLILSIGLLGMAGMQTSAVKDGLDVAKRSQVTWLVNEIVEQLRAAADADSANDPDGRKNTDTLRDAFPATPLTIDTSACAAPATNCSDTTSTNASQCTGVEMAKQELVDTFCGQALPSGVQMANARDPLNLESVVINCNGGACSDTADITVTINWTSKSVTDSSLMQTSQKAAQQTSSISMTVRP